VVTEPYALTVAAASGLLASRELSAVGLAESVLSRIESVEPLLHAYVHVDADGALEAARRADAELAAGRRRGALHGIPVGIKDIIDVAGLPTRAGSAARADVVATTDAGVVERLREAGAVLVGKTVTHEFAFGATCPPARNAWDTECIPGGSSGGSGAAVAADACLAALGTDTGASVRNPASLNGVVGLKATYGRVSRRGVVPCSWTCDHVGPLAKTVEDAALVLGAIAGHDRQDASSSAAPVPDWTADLDGGVAGLRIGVAERFFFENAHPDVEAAVRGALDVLVGLGAELVPVDIPYVEHSLPAAYVLVLVEGASYHRRELAAKRALYSEPVRAFLDAGSVTFGTAYVDALRVRAVIARSFRDVFRGRRLDALVAPTSSVGPVRVGESFAVGGDGEPRPLLDHYARLTCPFNLAGMPAISVPCGFDADRHPVGLQIAGRPFYESTVLRVAAAYERATPWHTLRPDLRTEALA